jgi:histidine ammonia-lyase
MHTITIDGFNLTAQQVISVARAPHLKWPWPIPPALP